MMRQAPRQECSRPRGDPLPRARARRQPTRLDAARARHRRRATAAPPSGFWRADRRARSIMQHDTLGGAERATRSIARCILRVSRAVEAVLRSWGARGSDAPHATAGPKRPILLAVLPRLATGHRRPALIVNSKLPSP